MLQKSLSKEKLQLALSDNKSYAGTQPYIEALESGDTKLLIQKINPVFVEILTSDKVVLMSKLLVLRMYKDIFLIGNMDLFDEIDPAVQEAIISAAAYNPKFRSKGKSDKETRGGMYFVQLQKRPKNTQSLQIGNSFVIFSTQIIRFFAAWLPQYPKKEQSRFMEAYHELQALGVQFNTNIYLQIEEKKKFQKNFQQWNKIKKEKRIQKQNESNEQQMLSSKVDGRQKKELEEKSDSKIFLLEQSVKNKNQQVMKIKKELQNLKKTVQEEKIEKKKLQGVLEQRNGEIIILRGENQNLKSQIQSRNNAIDNNNYFQELEKIKKQVKQLMEEKSKLTNINNSLTEKFAGQQTVIKELNTRCTLLEGQLQRKNEQNQILRQQSEIKIQNKQNLISQLKNKVEGEIKTTQQIQKNLQMRQKQLSSKNSQIDELLVKISELQNALFRTTGEIGAKKQQNEIKCDIKEEKQLEKISSINYNEICKDQNQKINKFKKKEKQQRDSVNKLSVNSSLTLQNPYSKNGNSYLCQMNRYDKNQLIRLMHKSKNSMHKTQCSKFRQQFSNIHTDLNFKEQKSTPLSQVDFNNSYNRQAMSQNNFFKIKQKDFSYQDQIRKEYRSKNIAASVYPLIQEYFYPLRMSETQLFRAACISEEARQLPFYSDQFIQFRMCQSQLKQIQSYKFFKLHLKNIYHQPITVRLTSQNQQIKIKKQNSQIWICSSGVAIVQIQAFVSNLNFRFPIFNMFILTQNSPQQKGKIQYSTEVPIPITLFNLSELTENAKDILKFDRYKENCYKKHKSEKLSINPVIKNLPSAFPHLTFRKLKNKNLQTQIILTYPLIPEIKIKLIIIQDQKFCQFCTEFLINSKNSQAFSKVILQALMFICG